MGGQAGALDRESQKDPDQFWGAYLRQAGARRDGPDPRSLGINRKLYTPWSSNRLCKGIWNSLVEYFGGVFSPGFTPIFLQTSPPNSPEHPQSDPLKIPEKVAE